MIDTLEDIWTGLLDLTAQFVIPDWGSVIGLLPILILLGVVGPFVTFLLLGIVIYQVRKPRTKVTFLDGPRLAELDEAGRPVFPPGLPFCRRDRLVFTSGTIRCDRCDDPLAVICPMCGLGRDGVVETCTNCGLVLKVRPRPVAVRPASGPKPGGAAVA